MKIIVDLSDESVERLTELHETERAVGLVTQAWSPYIKDLYESFKAYRRANL